MNSAQDISNHATPPQKPDTAYGVKKAKELAVGKFWGIPAEKARVNADNWVFMALGKRSVLSCKFDKDIG